ncbi:uncharacterized protein LOC143211173 [Lasioglossum baleicum]|uniref:uncharacterized protein LOC143211173 n=1 Tax=Lasioglossum baleicum TaxID=434251 RepID=UPI003FCCA0FB
MSLIDWIPVVSQLKSLVQLVDGNTEGAKRTQMNFLRECPGVSYLTNIVQLAAMETKKRCIRTVNNVLNSIPFIGHLKGHRHHVTGNYNGRNQAWTAATRSIVVLCCYSVAADAESEGP